MVHTYEVCVPAKQWQSVDGTDKSRVDGTLMMLHCAMDASPGGCWVRLASIDRVRLTARRWSFGFPESSGQVANEAFL